MAQSSNDSFPSAMYIAAAVNAKERLIPAVSALRDAIRAKAQAWSDHRQDRRTHMQDATPLTLGQEWSAMPGCCQTTWSDRNGLQGVYRLALGGTAVGTASTRRPALPKPRPPRSPGSLAPLRHGAQQIHGPRRA